MSTAAGDPNALRAAVGTSRSSAPTDELGIPYGKASLFAGMGTTLVPILVVLWLAQSSTSLAPHTAVGFVFYGFVILLLATLLAYFSYLFFTTHPGLVLNSVGIRYLMPGRGLDPGLISWTELAGARPALRLASGQLRGGRGSSPLWHVDLVFRDPEKFLSRLGAAQQRYRTPYYREYGIPYAICVAYFQPKPEEIAETIRRYIAKYGGSFSPEGPVDAPMSAYLPN
ncbi:MAG TPA: hypothetical protein VGM96_17045 [Reyranella sp.]|jgi:hypothetical protein